MRRRSLLKLGAGALPLATVPSAASVTTGPQDEPYSPLDSVEVEGATEAVLHHDGQVAYVAADDGFAAVDVSDPAALGIIAERRGIDLGGDRPLRTIWDLDAWADRLLVAGPSHLNPESGQGFALFDVADPAAPRRVAAVETAFHVHNCFIDDSVVYLTGTGLVQEGIPLVMYDVTGDDPVEVGRWSVRDHDGRWADVPLGLRTLHDVYVQDGIAYLPIWDAGTWLVDVSAPAAPAALDRVGEFELADLREVDANAARQRARTPPGNAHYACVDDAGSLLAVGKESWAVETDGDTVGGASGVDLYDVSDPADVRHLATIDPPQSFDQTTRGWFTTAHNCDLAGGRLYTAWYVGGVTVHDVSDPANPEELAWWRDPRAASFWTAQAGAGEFFVASSTRQVLRDALAPDRGRLYTFPDRAGRQPDPPSLTDRPADLLGSAGTPTPAAGASPGDTPTDGRTPAQGADTPATAGGEGGSDGNTGGDTADDSGPGFGAWGALAAVGGAGYVLARRFGRKRARDGDS